MNIIGVNNSEHKSFRSSATELLTRYPQGIHDLLTELFASARDHREKLKTPDSRNQLDADLQAFTEALITGWKLCLSRGPNPNTESVPIDSKDRHSILTRQYRCKGFALAVELNERLLKLNAHASQARHAPSGTNPCVPSESTEEPPMGQS